MRAACAAPCASLRDAFFVLRLREPDKRALPLFKPGLSKLSDWPRHLLRIQRGSGASVAIPPTNPAFPRRADPVSGAGWQGRAARCWLPLCHLHSANRLRRIRPLPATVRMPFRVSRLSARAFPSGFPFQPFPTVNTRLFHFPSLRFLRLDFPLSCP